MSSNFREAMSPSNASSLRRVKAYTSRVVGFDLRSMKRTKRARNREAASSAGSGSVMASSLSLSSLADRPDTPPSPASWRKAVSRARRRLDRTRLIRFAFGCLTTSCLAAFHCPGRTRMSRGMKAAVPFCLTVIFSGANSPSATARVSRYMDSFISKVTAFYLHAKMDVNGHK